MYSLRIISSCINTTETSRRLTITFQSRYTMSINNHQRHSLARKNKLTPPLSTFDVNTNMSWYLYTQELIQNTSAAANTTRGASGAKTIATVPMNKMFVLGASPLVSRNGSTGE